MILEISKHELIGNVKRQLLYLLGEERDIAPYVDMVLLRTERCFSRNINKYYHDNGEVYFSPFHSGQYSIFLYYLANTIYQSANNESLATKVYYLNKIMNSVDWYYEIELPEFWGVEHPIGSVLGRAKYSNGFFIYQGCTVGGNKGKYPKMGRNVALYSNATILGDTNVGDNVIISTGTTIKDEEIPSNCLVFGQSPNLIIKPKDDKYIQKLISNFWKSDLNKGVKK